LGRRISLHLLTAAFGTSAESHGRELRQLFRRGSGSAWTDAPDRLRGYDPLQKLGGPKCCDEQTRRFLIVVGRAIIELEGDNEDDASITLLAAVFGVGCRSLRSRTR